MLVVQPFTYAGTERNNASQNKRKKPGNGEVPENGGGERYRKFSEACVNRYSRR